VDVISENLLYFNFTLSYFINHVQAAILCDVRTQ